MLFSRFAQSAAALLLLTVGFAAPVHAQENKQIISGTWYEDRATTTTLSSTSAPILTFAQTPANQFLNITNVSCAVTTSAAQIISAVTLDAGTTSGAPDLGRPYSIEGNITPQTKGNSTWYSIVTNPIFYKFGPGRFPSIKIETQSLGSFSVNASCVIVGNLSDN
jgi:hypothetical protein